MLFSLLIVVMLGSFAENTEHLVMVFEHFIRNVLFYKNLMPPTRAFYSAHTYFLHSNN